MFVMCARIFSLRVTKGIKRSLMAFWPTLDWKEHWRQYIYLWEKILFLSSPITVRCHLAWFRSIYQQNKIRMKYYLWEKGSEEKNGARRKSTKKFCSKTFVFHHLTSTIYFRRIIGKNFYKRIISFYLFGI